MVNHKEQIAELKIRFLEYYKELPIIKLAAGWIGRTDDTITNWRKEDPEFSEQIDIAKSEWAKKTTKQVRSKEWLLERIMKDHFAQRNEVTGEDGGPVQFSNLTDEQLDEYINTKIRKAGVGTTSSGEGETSK